jgi:hypothetical protein
VSLIAMSRPVLVALCATVLLVPQILLSQATPPKPDSARMGGMSDHVMGTWKEMNAFHMLMSATWHPASQKNDLAPLREKAADLAKTAEAWAASKAPIMPHGCQSEAVTKAVARVAADSKALAAMVHAGTEDAKLKESLGSLHDTFEIAEKGCGGHGDDR